MSHINCGYCESDIPCLEASDSKDICREDYTFQAGDTYKAFACDLSATLESLFNNGKASVYADYANGTARLAVYNQDRGINGDIAVDCDLWNCDFELGGTNGQCQNVLCTCGWQCSPLTLSLVESFFSGNKPTGMLVDENTGKLELRTQGAPFPIEGFCNASACVPDPNFGKNITTNLTDDNANDDESEINSVRKRENREPWEAEGIFAIFVLVVVFGSFLLLTWGAYIILLFTGSSPRQSSGNPHDATEQAPLAEDDVEGAAATSKQTTKIDRLSFQNVSCFVRKRLSPRDRSIVLLRNVNGSAQSGKVLGIMGPSGAGKTTLLKILAAAHQSGTESTGQIRFNNKPLTKNYQRAVGYVPQIDELYETLTVRECIEYSAVLRLSRRLSAFQKQRKVGKTLEELRLTSVADNHIQTISGGERKRVSIGMEVVTESKLLLLDEPTSGLDSYAAGNIICLLKDLASKQHLIVALSIHQPSAKSFQSLDQILLLSQGQVVFNGKPNKAKAYFERQGFASSVSKDLIAEHMLEVVSNPANVEVLAKAANNKKNPSRASSLSSTDDEGDREGDQEELQENENTGHAIPNAERVSVFQEIAILYSRTAKAILRSRTLFALQSLTSVCVALLGGAIFHDVADNLAGFQNRMGAFYFALTFFGFTSFSSMEVFIQERRIFVRESGSHYYRVFSYFITKAALDSFLLRVVPVTIFACILYWIMGLKNTAEAFFIFWAAMVLFNMCAGIMSICISIGAPTVGVANLVSAVWFLVMLLFGGFLVNIDTMSPSYAWLKYVSIFYYTFEILITNELSGVLLSFDAPGYPEIPVFGEVFLATIGMEVGNQMRNFICLCGVAVGCGVLAYVLLWLRTPPSAASHERRRTQNSKLLPELE